MATLKLFCNETRTYLHTVKRMLNVAQMQKPEIRSQIQNTDLDIHYCHGKRWYHCAIFTTILPLKQKQKYLVSTIACVCFCLLF